MKITFKPYDKTNEIDLLVKDEDLLFKGKGAPAEVWIRYTNKDSHVHFLKVFIDDEFAGILCWGIMEKFGWDKKDVYFKLNEIDKLSPADVIKNVSWLYAIALFDKFKGKGLSHQLIKKYESESKKDGAEWLGLHVAAKNNARFLYMSSKFKKVITNEKSWYMVKKI